MEVAHQLILRRCHSCTLVEVHHLLVVAVHKVNLETLDTHLGVVLHHAVHISVQCPVACPQYDTYATLLGIVAQMLNVNLGNNLHKVSLLVYRPTLVQDNILYAVARCEVDIILVCAVVDAGEEVHAIQTPIVPPIPSNLARLDPRRVANGVGLAQAEYHIVIE